MSARRALPLLLGLLLGLLTTALLFGSRARFHREMDFNRGALEDFRHFYYPTARGFLDSGEATEGFLYPPSLALALVPLARLDLESAAAVWWGLELVATAVLIGAVLVLTRPGPRLAGVAAFLCVTSVPLAHNLHWGQVSILLGLAVLAAVLAELRGHPRLAVLAVALAAAVKLYPLLFLAVPLARREPFRVLGGLLAAASLVVLPSALAIGPGETVEFLRQVGEELARRRPFYFEAPNAQALGPVLHRWLGLEGTWLAWVGLVLFLAQGPRLVRWARDPLRAYALVAASLPLVVEPHWPHYLVLLPFVQTVCLTRGGGDRTTLALAGLSALLSSLVVFRLLEDPEAYGGAGLLAVANGLALLALRRTGDHSSTTTL